MKPNKLIIPFLMGCGLCLAQITATAQEFKTHISKQFAMQQPAAASVLAIYNVFGSIKVEGYSGDKVIMEIDETISAENPAELEKGKKEFKLDFSQTKDTIMAYISEPYDTRPHVNWRHNDDRHIEYKVHLDFVVKVPNNINLRVSTVNNGEVDIKDVYGNLKLNNVNGGIAVVNAKGTSDIHTINGPVTVNYLTVPTGACSYYTINGKMEVTFPKNLSADMQFKSMNGKFYTDFDEVEALPSQVTKTQDKKANGTIYRLNKNTQVRVGAGGKLFKFETLNGNIYIKKQS
jgi:hypothetical protein